MGHPTIGATTHVRSRVVVSAHCIESVPGRRGRPNDGGRAQLKEESERKQMTVDTSRENTYQWLLRALGAYLDEEPSCRISLAEVSDGFLVRLQRALHKLDPQVEHF